MCCLFVFSNKASNISVEIILFIFYLLFFSFVDPLLAVAITVSFVIDTVKDENTKWYKFGRESLMSCLAEVSRCMGTLCACVYQSEGKPKPIVTYSHSFSHVWRRPHVFASSSDWFTGLSATVVIGPSNYFGVGVTTLN